MLKLQGYVRILVMKFRPARMAELADALASGASGPQGHGGSSPPSGTM